MRGAEEGALRAPARCDTGNPSQPPSGSTMAPNSWQQQRAIFTAAFSSPSSWALRLTDPMEWLGSRQGCAQAPSPGWWRGAWLSPHVLSACGKGKVTLPGYGRFESARHLLPLWGASGKGQSQLPPTRALVLHGVAWHKGPRAARSFC